MPVPARSSSGRNGVFLPGVPQFSSLRHKVLFPLLLLGVGGVLVAAALGRAEVARRVEAQAQQRAAVLVSAVAHAGAAQPYRDTLRALVAALGSAEEVNLLVLVGDSPPRVLASTLEVWQGLPLERLPWGGLGSELTAALEERRHIRRFRQDGSELVEAAYFPLRLDGRTHPAAVLLQLDTRAAVEQVMRDTWLETSLVLLVLGILLAVTCLLLQRLVLEPAGELARTMERRAAGEAAFAPEGATDELGALARGLNEMLRAMARQEERYRSLVSHIPGAVFRRSGRDGFALEFISEAIAEICGYHAAQFLAAPGGTMRAPRSLADLVLPEDATRVEAMLTRAVESGQPYEVEYRLRSACGSVRWVSERGRVAAAADGACGLEGVLLDVTAAREAAAALQGYARELEASNRRIEEQARELRARAAELAEARDRATEASRAKSAFLANMSHELRTPLNAIIGYSEMLAEEAMRASGDRLAPRAEEGGLAEWLPDLRRIHGAGKHLLELINDILDLSKIEAGRMDVHLSSFDVDELVSGVMDTVRPLALRNGNQLLLQASSSLGSMESDPVRVRQALLNLMSNACKFTEGGTVTLRTRRVRRGNGGAGAGEWLEFEVEDTGIGLSPDQVSRLFHDFVQADSSTTRKYGGTGLGLAITRRFTEMLGGTVEVKSELGQGSLFTLRLPAVAPQATPDRLSSPAPAESISPPADGPTGIAGDPHAPVLLVIDDDPTVHDLMRRAYTREGFRVATASEGEQGLRLARELHPAVITLDVMMPGMDGWTVLTALKADPELRPIPVVMLTMVDDRSMGLALGVAEYMTKPLDREQLATVLRRYRGTARVGPVLLVEDDDALRGLLRVMLEKAGFAVCEARDGAAALEAVRREHPALVLLDLLMPGMDGFQFVEAIRSGAEHADLPILVLTGLEAADEQNSRLGGDVQQVLRKDSVTREGLVDEVRRLLEGTTEAAGTHTAKVREEEPREQRPEPAASR